MLSIDDSQQIIDEFYVYAVPIFRLSLNTFAISVNLGF